MKYLIIKSVLLVLLLASVFAVGRVNSRYEIFAVNRQMNDNNKVGTFRVMTYNINAPIVDDNIESVKAILIGEINKQSPDILCLQESSTIFKSIQVSLDSLFGYTDSMVIKKQPLRYCLYSKKPIRNFKRYKCITEIDATEIDSIKREIRVIQNGMPVYSAEIEVKPGKWVTVFSCHLRSSAYSTARRSMEDDASWMDGLPIYYAHYKLGARIRNYEADNLRLHLEELEAEGTPIIIAGDFNDWSGSYCMNTIRNGLYKDAWWEGGFGLGITYDEWHLKLRIDHILYSQHFELESVRVDKNPFSDHYPLVADFRLIE